MWHFVYPLNCVPPPPQHTSTNEKGFNLITSFSPLMELTKEKLNKYFFFLQLNGSHHFKIDIPLTKPILFQN
jgi:hypothetical protein